MPAYDYVCDNCGHTFEIRQSFTDEPITICPICDGHVRRVISPPPIIFKGSGWYITDSKRPNASLNTPKTDASKPDDKEKAKEAAPASGADTAAASEGPAKDAVPAAPAPAAPEKK